VDTIQRRGPLLRAERLDSDIDRPAAATAAAEPEPLSRSDCRETGLTALSLLCCALTGRRWPGHRCLQRAVAPAL
jgi:hypothetical protein